MPMSDGSPMGRVHAIHVSSGGVPKQTRDRCVVRADGLDGDRQRDLRHHGGPLRAVSLYSLELIEALQAEGHLIAPGTTGENLTLAGVRWDTLAIGTRLDVGAVALTLTGYAHPCTNIASSFRDEAFVRISQKVHPGWSRYYAKVDREGEIRVGDAVRVTD
jgi:MOSC domain-containing protein YiiM